MKTIILFICLLFLPASTGFADCPVPMNSAFNQGDQDRAISVLGAYFVCSAGDPGNDQSPCNTFAGRGLEAIYNVTDFKTATGYMLANQILDFVSHSDAWHKIGPVLDADNNLCAQAAVNQGHPTVAVSPGDPHGHIAMAIPGLPVQASKWNILTVNSASFLYNKPAQSYLGGPLSGAWKKEDAVNAVFYFRD
jgi:hypothetical protein